MKKQMIIVGKGARVLSEKEMKHVLGGQDDIIIGDLTACNNKKMFQTVRLQKWNLCFHDMPRPIRTPLHVICKLPEDTGSEVSYPPL